MPRDSYRKWDFANFTESGLEVLTEAFAKFKCRVVDIDATNKPVRAGGQQTKRAVLSFSDGQSIQLQINSSGALYQARLNNRVIPVREKEDVDGIARELAIKVKTNRKAFKEKMGKQAEKLMVSVADKPKKKVRNTKARLQERREYNAAKAEQLASLRKRINDLNSKNEEGQALIVSKEKELEDIEFDNISLQEKIREAKTTA